jgi:hypothetical protein
VLTTVIHQVDPIVAAKLFANLGKYARDTPDTTMVMALNQVQLLQSFDDILFLEQGAIAAHGSFGELQKECAAFSTLVKNYGAGEDNAVVDLMGGAGAKEGKIDSACKDMLYSDLPPSPSSVTNSVADVTTTSGQTQLSTVVARGDLALAKATTTTAAVASKIVKAETKQTGQVKGSLYYMYFKSMGWCRVGPAFFFGCTGYFLSIGMDLLVS